MRSVPFRDADSGDDKRGWHGGGGGGWAKARQGSSLSSLAQLSSGPIVMPAFSQKQKGPVPLCLFGMFLPLSFERIGKDGKSASFDSKPLLILLPLREGAEGARPALTEGDACMWCSLRRTKNFIGPPLSDGDALPFSKERESLLERGAWLPAVRAGRVRAMEEIARGGITSFLFQTPLQRSCPGELPTGRSDETTGERKGVD